MSTSYRAKKRFGQNFLQDPFIIQRIINIIQPNDAQINVEIGPGLGALTYPILEKIAQLHVIELDKNLVERLQIASYTSDQLIVHSADALQFNFSSLISCNKQLKVFGNLPYNISTPLLFHLLSFIEHIDSLFFMLQKEVVDRIVAKPNDKNYGRLSIMLQYFCAVENMLFVPPQSFSPRPKVDSAIVKLVPYKEKSYVVQDPILFSEVVTQAFSMRRKTLKNNLKSRLQENDFIDLQIDSQLRPENLTVEQYVNITNFLSNKEL